VEQRDLRSDALPGHPVDRALAAARGQHIRVDVVLRAVPDRTGWIFEWIVDGLALACCLVIAYSSARAALASFKAGPCRSRPW